MFMKKIWEKLCYLIGKSHQCSQRNGSSILLGFGFVLGASILVLVTIISMLPLLMNFMLPNNVKCFYTSSSTTCNTTIVAASFASSNSYAEFPKNSTETHQPEKRRTDNLFENSTIVSMDQQRDAELVGTKDSFNNASSSISEEDCDLFEGEWVRDHDRNKYYSPGSCPYVEEAFACNSNGRPDDEFLHWRWQSGQQTNAACNNILSYLNATDFLERLRGKKLVYTGDSLNRNMFGSLLCILWNAIPNKSRVFKPPGNTDFTSRGDISLTYADYNCTVVFVWAPFLVNETNIAGRRSQTELKPEPETLRLDVINEKAASVYRDADVIVFNSWHWWTDQKTNKGLNYFQEGNYLYPKLRLVKAYKKALNTWSNWIDKNIDSNKTQVVFRGYSVPHFVGGRWNTGGKCNLETMPINSNKTYVVDTSAPKMKILENTLRKMKTPVIYLNISKLSYYRADGHPSLYQKYFKTTQERMAATPFQDCIHWCLPGVPDTWNELLYASLLKAGKGSFHQRAPETNSLDRAKQQII
ncbi:hypothetical protein C5167_006349 [Papaver somniferum]|uniref:Uncharacterized protein n=1 Tax=Papaver somniferum TaxID=3469 RepID=A0A4Y7JD61_PAPSO|nr:protein trichome birefringence-like 2 [Papaver somniferum]RZC59043.1 hypothetical protein C5167_006349 [Papaver somniferum]